MSLRIVLASKSAARGTVLRGAGLTFDTADAGVDEDLVKHGLLGRGASPKEVAHVLAEEKAKAASLREDGLVIGADQTLDFDGELVDKAATVEEARARLTSFRGRPHQLHSGLAVARAGALVFSGVESATLHVRRFTDAWLDGYMERNGEAVLGSVGCYHLEGEGAQLFERIDGDFFTVLGLPLLTLLDVLRSEGAIEA
jgi:septum formation protein